MKITFLTFYNDYSIGINVLSSILINNGYDVSVIFFKLPSKEKIEWFRQNTVCSEHVNIFGDIMSVNSEVNRWTDTEVQLLKSKINSLNTDILCISSRTPDNELCMDVLPIIRNSFKGVMLAGGYGPTLDPEIYVNLVDYVFIGEAETDIINIISSIEKNISIDSLDNICFKKNGKLIKNKLKKPSCFQFKTQIFTNNTFYIDNNSIITLNKNQHNHTYSTFLGRGCIKGCTYCSAGQWYKVYLNEGIRITRRRNRPIQNVMDELLEIKNQGYTFIFFRDEFLSVNTNTLSEFFKWYEHNISIPFWCYLVPSQIIEHPEVLKHAVDAGFVDTEVGFQSGSDRINKDIFRRKLSVKKNIAYTRMLANYKINMKFDFIIFNPAETIHDIKKTFQVIQSLPKKRSYLYLPRLLYYPGTPINDVLNELQINNLDFDYYYRIALLYLICFVSKENEFDKILNNNSMVSSSNRLLRYYKNYLERNEIEFVTGTHTVPDSITTHRYQRIVQKNECKDIVILGSSDYFKEMTSIFNCTNIIQYLDERNAIPTIDGDIPIFICSPNKQKLKIKFYQSNPTYNGKVYV